MAPPLRSLSPASFDERAGGVSTLVTGALLSLSLVACSGDGGGGGGSTPPPLPPNTPPTAQAVSFTTTEDTPSDATFSAQDAEQNPLTFSIAAPPTQGTVTLLGGVEFRYTPNSNYFGADTFSYSVNDGRASATATVSITVTAVNDPPQIDVTGPSPATTEGSATTIAYTVSDIDDATPNVTALQLAGSSVTGLTASSTGVSFVAPTAVRVEEVLLRITATDAQNATTTRDVSVTIHPLSASGMMRTIYGSTVDNGIDWVIIAEGYTSGELAKFYTDARVVADFMMSLQPVIVYTPAWNVHLVSTVSNESGIDVPAESTFRDTALNSSFCGSNTVCSDVPTVLQAVVAEQPAYDIVLVIVNTSLRGGSGGSGGSVITSTTHTDLTTIVLHEFGHSFAGLADEYVDPNQAAMALPGYQEDLYPNITRLSDTAQTKWRHWFADPANVPSNPGQTGVGLFEGAFFHDTGFYRPADHSFMRLTTNDLSDVHVEAWGLSVYRVGGRFRSVTPSAAAVNVARGTPTTFSVTPLLPVPAQSIVWLLDGTEPQGTRDSTTFTCCDQFNLQNGAHQVAVKVFDATGEIRQPAQDLLPPVKTWAVDYQ